MGRINGHSKEGLEPLVFNQPHVAFRIHPEVLMSISQSDADSLRHEVAASLHKHWVFYLVEGIILICLGAAAVIVPAIATLAVTIFLGWLFLISGTRWPV